MAKIETLVEVVFEVRFLKTHLAIIELLPGILHERLRKEGLKTEIETLPFPELPKEVIDLNRDLAYLPRKRISLKDKNIYMQFAYGGIFLNNPKPYMGWEKFKEFIELLLKTIYDLDIEHAFERFSLRYINLIPENLVIPREAIRMEINVGGWTEANFRSFGLSFEVIEENLNVYLQLIHPAKVVGQYGESEGILVDIQAYEDQSEELSVEKLEKMHSVIKHIFFNRLISENLKDRLGG